MTACWPASMDRVYREAMYRAYIPGGREEGVPGWDIPLLACQGDLYAPHSPLFLPKRLLPSSPTVKRVDGRPISSPTVKRVEEREAEL